MLEYLRKVEKTGQELIITDNHRPVLKVVPIKNGGKTNEIFAKYQHPVGSDQDVLASTIDEWGDYKA
jgi:antitoxin (DNA-binding transcriptional repressor) of toxin-antitoxin stability system